MSETTKEETGKTASKKPATAKKEETKESLWTRMKNCVKRNKKAIAAFGIGAGTGVAGTITYGIVSAKRREKRAQQAAYIPAEPVDPEYGSPLDPNV